MRRLTGSSIQLLPGKFDGLLSFLKSIGTYLLVGGRFTKIKGGGGFPDKPACNLAWIDLLSGSPAAWQTTPTPIPLYEINCGIEVPGGILLGGIGGLYPLVPEMGMSFLGDPHALRASGGNLALPNSPTHLLPSATFPTGSAILPVTNANLVAFSPATRGGSLATLDPSTFQSTEWEVRELLNWKGTLIAHFRHTSENWVFQCSHADPSSGGLLDEFLNSIKRKSRAATSIVCRWNQTARNWENLGTFEQPLTSLVATREYLYAIQCGDGCQRFLKYNHTTWETIRSFWRDSELVPSCLTSQGDEVLLGLGTSSTFSGDAVLRYNPNSGAFTSIGIEVGEDAIGGGAGLVLSLPNGSIFVGGGRSSCLRVFGQNARYGVILRDQKIVKGSSEFLEAFNTMEATVIEGPDGKRRLAIAYTTDAKNVAFSWDAEESRIQILAL